MQIIIVGCSLIGSHLARVVANEGHDVIVVDPRRESFQLLGPDFPGLTVVGIPYDEDVLRNAGIEQADGLAATTTNDNSNMMICQIAKEFFHVSRIVACIQNPGREQVFYQFGVETICPTNLAVSSMRRFLTNKENYDACFIENAVVNFFYEPIGKEVAGTLLREHPAPKDTHLLGLLRDGELYFYNDSLTLEENDSIVLVRKARKGGAL